MTINLENSVYIQPSIDYDAQDGSIPMKMDYVTALNQGGLISLIGKIASCFIPGAVDSVMYIAGTLLCDTLTGGAKIVMYGDNSDPNNPKAKIEFYQAGASVATDTAILTLAATGVIVLTPLTAFLTAIAGYVTDDAIAYNLIGKVGIPAHKH